MKMAVSNQNRSVEQVSIYDFMNSSGPDFWILVLDPNCEELDLHPKNILLEVGKSLIHRSHHHIIFFSQLIGAEGEYQTGAENCYSILVETGVYSPDDETDQQVFYTLEF